MSDPLERSGTFVLRVADVELEPGELDPASVASGSPVVTETVLGESPDGRIVRGIWRITEGTVTDTEEDEIFVVLEGRRHHRDPGQLGGRDVCILERGARTDVDRARAAQEGLPDHAASRRGPWL